MKVIVKNRLFTLAHGSTVTDESGREVYKVKGKVLSPTKVKKVYDMAGNKLYKVRNKFFNFFVHKTFIYGPLGKIATVKDKFFNTKGEYFVLGNKDEIKIEGKFFSPHSTIYRNGEPIGHMRIVTFVADSFELEAEPEDMPFLIALVIAVDNIRDKIKG